MNTDDNEEQTIRSEAKSYFTIIPNCADDDLSTFEFRLYAHYCRVCGQGGTCYEKVRTTAKILGMGVATVVETRRKLAERTPPYIQLIRHKVRNFERVHVILPDLWPQNIQRYANGTDRQEKPYRSRRETVLIARRNGTDRQEKPLKKNIVKEEPFVEEKPIEEKYDDADLRSSPLRISSSKNGSTRDHADQIQATRNRNPINAHAAIRCLLDAWHTELFGYGEWDNWPAYLDSIQPHRLYELLKWFYRFRSRPAWGATIDNAPGFIIHQMETPGGVAGLSPAERTALHAYIDEAEAIATHFTIANQNGDHQ